MTRLSKRPKRHGGVYSEMDIGFLSRGPHGVPCAMTTAEVAGDDDAIKAAWESLKATILPAWIRERPGTRCWGSWHCEFPERRQRIDGKPHPFDNKERSLHVARTDRPDFWKKAYSLRFGMPSAFIPPFDSDLLHDFMENILHGRESEIFEQEWSYLARLNLLLPEDSP